LPPPRFRIIDEKYANRLPSPRLVRSARIEGDENLMVLPCKGDRAIYDLFVRVHDAVHRKRFRTIAASVDRKSDGFVVLVPLPLLLLLEWCVRGGEE
jgi:GGDEF domain-containing protein